MFRKFSNWFDKPPSGKSTYPKGQGCEYPGCVDEGIYRAPKSRYHLESGSDDWHWFCLIHIRDYNAKWNYYSNMSEREIEEERRSDVTWKRPTWPLGSSKFVGGDSDHSSLQDPFGLFSGGSVPDCYGTNTPEGKALAALSLSYPFTPQELRKRYRELVKKYHPDTNGSSPEAVEKIKEINEAYEILKKLNF